MAAPEPSCDCEPACVDFMVSGTPCLRPEDFRGPLDVGLSIGVERQQRGVDVAHEPFIAGLQRHPRHPQHGPEMGPLAETFVLNELRAWLGYSGADCRLCFWRSYDGAEVDVVCETVEGFVAIEIQGVTTMGETLQPRPAPGPR